MCCRAAFFDFALAEALYRKAVTPAGGFSGAPKSARYSRAREGDRAALLVPDGILLGSPTYVADVSPEIKALIDRACMVGNANGGMFRRKVGAGVIAVRRAGAMHAFDALNHFFLISEMIIPRSSYWNIGIGREPGEVETDQEGIRTMKVLGRNMAWLLKKLAS